MRTYSLLFIAICSYLPFCAYAQVDYAQLVKESSKWTVEQAENIVDTRISDLYDYQQCNIRRLYEPAKKKYDAILIFHTEVFISSGQEETIIQLFLEDSEMPFDLYYVNRGNTKVVIPSYEGKFEYADTHFSAPYYKMGQRTNRALRIVLRRHPDIIFIWEVYPFNYMYIKNGEVFIFDSFTRKTHLLIESIEYLEQKIKDNKEMNCLTY